SISIKAGLMTSSTRKILGPEKEVLVWFLTEELWVLRQPAWETSLTSSFATIQDSLRSTAILISPGIYSLTGMLLLTSLIIQMTQLFTTLLFQEISMIVAPLTNSATVI